MKYLFLLIGLLSFSTFAQDKDPKAQAVLDKVSTKMKALKSFYIEFSANIKNTEAGTNESETGKGWVKGNKFYASYGDNTIISNGMKTWTVVKEERAVYETDADDDDEESINPKKLMTIWEDGFKNKYIGTEKIGTDDCHKIYLFPKDTKKVDYHTIVIYISKTDNELKRTILKSKDGTNMTYNLSKFEENPAIDDEKFVYEPKKYPGYKLIKD